MANSRPVTQQGTACKATHESTRYLSGVRCSFASLPPFRDAREVLARISHRSLLTQPAAPVALRRTSKSEAALSYVAVMCA